MLVEWRAGGAKLVWQTPRARDFLVLLLGVRVFLRGLAPHQQVMRRLLRRCEYSGECPRSSEPQLV